MRALRASLVVFPVLLALAGTLSSRARGIYLVGITRGTPACGQCHNPMPGASAGFPPITVAVLPSERVLRPGQSISVTASATGGQTASNLGGFAMDATAGTLSVGFASRLWLSASAITHDRRTAGRSWSFGYTAPASAGLVEFYCVINTVDLSGSPNAGDMWAFHGFDQSAASCTPVRLFVNAPGVLPIGTSCVGSFRNFPVLGSAEPPSRGNGNFAVQLHGAAPSSPVLLLLGTDVFTPPIDLSRFGATGCFLHVNPVVAVTGATTAGNPQRGEGTATFSLPLPATVRPGQAMYLQALVGDPSTGRPTPITATNALGVTIQ